jgi:fibronectin-binding autotransporter adhesin
MKSKITNRQAGHPDAPVIAPFRSLKYRAQLFPIATDNNLRIQMKTKIQTKSLLMGASVLGMILFVGATAPAANILQTVTEGSGTDWTAASWGSPAAVANSANTYETPSSSFTARTPNKNLTGLYTTNFAGSSLQIDTGGILYLKHGGNAADAAGVNLVLNGGAMTFHGAFAPTPAPVAGTLQVIANSTINTDQTGANSADIWLLSSVSGSSNLTLNMNTTTNGLVLFGNNSAYTGNWTNAGSSSFIEILSGTTNALGSGSVTMANANDSLIINSTNNMVIANQIIGPGSLVKLNTNLVNLSGNNTFTGPVQINAGVLQLGTSGAITNASLISLAGATLDASLIGGLTLNPAGQSMNCNGTVIGNLTVGTTNTNNFTLTATTNNILNVTGSLTLNGNPTLNVLLSGYKPSGVYRLINYSGTIQGGGSFNLVPPAGSTETFQLDTSTPGEVNLIVTGVVVNLTWVGDGAANDWDTTSPNWAGVTNVYAAVGDNVTFNDSGSSVPDINVVAAVTPNSMTVSNTIEQYVFDGSAITTAGSLTKMGTNELDFTSSGNNFSGPIAIQAGIVSIGVGGSSGNLGTGPITNNGVLQVNKSSGGAAFNAPISGTGSLNITGGGASVTIGATNSYSGGTTIGNGCQLAISTSSALGSGSATVLNGGRLGVTSLVGTMAVTNPVSVSGAYVSPGGALYVNTSGNNVTWSGPIAIGTGNDGILNQLRVVNVNARMNFSSPVLGTNEALECTSGNTAGDNTSVMTFDNTLSLGSGGSLLVDGLAVVVLAGGTNAWGGGTTVGYNGTSPYVTSSTATLLVNGTLHGGALEVENLATLGGSGIILDPVTVDGSVAPGNSGIGSLTVNNAVVFESDGAAVMEINRTNSPNASLLSATSVTYGGTLTVENIGTTNLEAGDTFELFNGAISGTFAVTNLPALPSEDLYWDTSLLNSGTIRVASSSSPAPAITSPSVSGTNFSLQVASSQIGFNYVVQATPALAPATWTSIQTNAGTGGTLNFTIPITPGTPRSFFRISVQ